MLFKDDIKLLEFLDVFLETRNYTPSWVEIRERTGINKTRAKLIINKLVKLGYLIKTSYGKDLDIFTLKMRCPANKNFKAKVICSGGIPQELWADIDLEIKFVDKKNDYVRIIRSKKPPVDEGIKE